MDKTIRVWLNDRKNAKRLFVDIDPELTIRDLKQKAAEKLLASEKISASAQEMIIQKWYRIYEDDKALKEYEIGDGTGLVLSYK